MGIFFLPFLLLPIWVTYVSIISFSHPRRVRDGVNDIIIVTIAPLLTIFVGNVLLNISNNHWTEVNVNTALHAPIEPQSIPTFSTLIALSLIGYIVLSYLPLEKLPPLILVLSIGFLYIGIALAFFWSIQMMALLTQNLNGGLIAYVLMCLMPWNYTLMCLRTIKKSDSFLGKAISQLYKTLAAKTLPDALQSSQTLSDSLYSRYSRIGNSRSNSYSLRSRT